MKTESLSPKALRERLVASAFPRFDSLSHAMQATGFVQADPIRSPARAQDLVLRQRVARYRAGDLEEAFPSIDLQEGFLFAYGFMTTEVWELTRSKPGMRLGKLERKVIDYVQEQGEAHPKALSEFLGKRRVSNAWGGKSQQAKQVLEHLHHHGFVRVCRREKGIRVYGPLPEMAAADSAFEARRFELLLLHTLRIFGPVSVRFLLSELRAHFHLMPSRSARLKLLDRLASEGKLSTVDVEGVKYLWIEENWPQGEVDGKVRVLAPFDPLVRDRERFEQLWSWMYRFEAYVPKPKRVRGYYAMPLLWGVEMLGWANVGVENGRMKMELGFEGKRPRARAFRSALEVEAESLALFLGLPSGAWEIIEAPR